MKSALRQCLYTSSLVLWAISASAQQRTTIVIEAGEKPRAEFVPRAEPYFEGGPSVAVFLFDRQDVRTSDGQAVTGFEFIGWTEGAATRVQVFALVPKDGVPNAYFPGGEMKNLRRRDFASYLLSSGQSQRVNEMTTLGIAPMVLRSILRNDPEQPGR